MAEGEIQGNEVEVANVIDVPAGAGVTITNHEPVLTDTGKETLENMKQDAAQVMSWPKHPYQMTPQAQATLNALKGNRK